MGGYILTATGKKYNVVHCGSISAILYIDFIGYSLPDIVAEFSKEEETVKIDYYFNGDRFSQSFEGFTVITDVSALDDEVRLALKNPVMEQ